MIAEDVAGLEALQDSLSAAEWEEALGTRDSRGLTPLGLALEAGKLPLVSCLLSLGAAGSIFVRNPGRSTVWGSRELSTSY